MIAVVTAKTESVQLSITNPLLFVEPAFTHYFRPARRVVAYILTE